METKKLKKKKTIFIKKKNDFYKNKKVTKIDDIDSNKIFGSKEEPNGTKIHSNTLPDTMTMMLLDHYA